jgi:hypothetical protein
VTGTQDTYSHHRIFIIEGILTIFISIVSWPLIVPFPEDCNFLDPEEKELMLARVKEGGHNAHDTITFRGAVKHLKDWKIWAG